MTKPINILLLLIAFFYCGLYYFIPLDKLNDNLFRVGCLVILIAIIAFYRATIYTELHGQWLRPSILFLVGYMVVNFQYITDYFLGIKDDTSTLLYYPETLNHCYILGLVGLLSFVLGYDWKKMPFLKTSVVTWIYPSTKILVALQIALFLLFLATINISEFITGSYYGNDERSAPMMEGLFYVANALIIIAIIKNNPEINNIEQYLRSFPLVSLVIISIYMLLRMLSGDRGPFIYTGLLLVFGYLYATRKKYSISKVLVTFFVGGTLMSVIGIARQMDLTSSFSDRIVQGFDVYTSVGRFGDRGESTCVPFTDELGFSFAGNQVSVNAVESKKSKTYHPMYMFWGILNGIPFMPSTIANVLKIAPEERGSSGFTNYYFFGSYDRNWGIGTTIVADFYLQLGVWGVLIGMFFTGIMLRKIDNVLFVEDKNCIGLYLLLFVLLFSAKSIYMPRATILVDWPRFVQGVLVLYFCRFFFNSVKK